MGVAILGMHRSGTSALTSLVDLLGCYTGTQDDFNQADASNPRGYWERKDVWALNEEILRKLGRTWYSVTDADLDALDEDDRGSFEMRAQELVRKLEPHAPWVIKDPRLCILFPIWKLALSRSVIIIIYRHPGEVAVSLQQRDHFPTHFSIALWEAHVVASLHHSKGLPRIVVSHKELLSDPLNLTNRLRRELGARGIELLREPEEQEIRDIIDPDLYRARIPAESEGKLNRAQETLLDKLEAGSLDLLDDAVLSEEACTARQLYAPLRQEHDELIVSSANLMEQERNNAAAESERLRKENSSIRNQLERLGIENRTLREENSSIRNQLERLGIENRTLREENSSIRNQLERLGIENSTLREENSSIRNQLERLGIENSTLREERSSLKSWLEELSVDLALLLRSRRMALIRLVPDIQRLRFGEWFWRPRVEKTHADFVKWREDRGDKWQCQNADDES